MSSTEKSNSGNKSTQRILRVLVIEDSPVDAFLLERALIRGGFRPQCHRVDTAETMTEALDQGDWDVILADHSMPRFSAPEALELTKLRGLDIPFIIVSGHIEEETAVSAMKAGAHDYIMKDRLARLVPAVERELREAELRRVQRACEAELRRAHDELEMRVEKRTADLRAANQKLEAVLEERRRLENELLEIAENERRSIGFDLHDDLGQKLTGVSLMLKGLEQRLTHDQHSCASETCKIRELIEQVIHHTHNLAHQFSSLDIQGEDLSCVFKELAANAEKMFGIPCLLAIKGTIPQLPANTILQFHKITQEAISNAIKHGKATRVWISVATGTDRLLLVIRNDGVPFSLPEGKKHRMGLRIMNYRANTVGASFDIKPNQKNGTIVTCTLPLKNITHRNGSHHSRPIKALPRNRARSEAVEHALS
jgi:signal transduction histidine kinase